MLDRMAPRAGTSVVTIAVTAAWLALHSGPAPATVREDAVPGAAVSASPTAKRATTILGWQETTRRVTAGERLSDRIRVLTDGRPAQRTVRLLQARSGSDVWRTIWRGKTSDRGRITLRWTAPDSGVWRYRAKVAGTSKARARTASTRRIVVWTPDTSVAPGPTEPTPSTESTVHVTGDIGQCGGAADKTAALIDSAPGPLVATGDLAYPNGTAADFANCYDPSYGRFTPITFPVPGNHEYNSKATAYFDYFGDRVGAADQPWYSVDVAGWRFYMLNSNCAQVGGCGTGSAQYIWLADQLRGDQPRCTAAVWHHPRWSSGVHGPDTNTAPLYTLLADQGTDLLLTGHEHNYERFARLDATGRTDPSGIREFVVGTGGAALREIPGLATGSEVRLNDSHGVLRLTLRAGDFDWRFVPTEANGGTDAGSEQCT